MIDYDKLAEKVAEKLRGMGNEVSGKNLLRNMEVSTFEKLQARYGQCASCRKQGVLKCAPPVSGRCENYEAGLAPMFAQGGVMS